MLDRCFAAPFSKWAWSSCLPPSRYSGQKTGLITPVRSAGLFRDPSFDVSQLAAEPEDRLKIDGFNSDRVNEDAQNAIRQFAV